MARPQTPCAVPGCKGVLETGKRDGATVAWCRACERRIAQLQSLREKLEATPVASGRGGEVTDAQLVKLVAERCCNLTGAETRTKRGANTLRYAIRSKALPSALLGRLHVIPIGALMAWSASYQRRPVSERRSREIIASLPRTEAEAVSLDAWAVRAKRSTGTLGAWARNNAKDSRLQRTAVLGKGARPVLAYWWKEATRG